MIGGAPPHVKFENHAFRIQEDYMAQLEESYQDSKKIKKAKRLRVSNSAKLIQRFYRRRLLKRHTLACIVIQRYWRKKQS